MFYDMFWGEGTIFLDFLVTSESPKRAVRFCCLRGNRLLSGCALTVSGPADSARPLIGCLDGYEHCVPAPVL